MVYPDGSRVLTSNPSAMTSATAGIATPVPGGTSLPGIATTVPGGTPVPGGTSLPVVATTVPGGTPVPGGTSLPVATTTVAAFSDSQLSPSFNGTNLFVHDLSAGTTSLISATTGGQLSDSTDPLCGPIPIPHHRISLARRADALFRQQRGELDGRRLQSQSVDRDLRGLGAVHGREPAPVPVLGVLGQGVRRLGCRHGPALRSGDNGWPR